MEEIYSAYMCAMDPYIQIQAAALYDQYRTFSAYRPWPKRPFLSHEPPLLQHPEKVVRSKDTSRFERTFQPNVALKPQHPPTPPSSDEITSSTSPPPAPSSHAPPATPPSPLAPPPDCELSTDTDEEDAKEHATIPPICRGEGQPHIRKAVSVKEKPLTCVKVKDLIAIKSETNNDQDRIQEERLLEELVRKEEIIVKQAEELLEKNAFIARLLKEKDELIAKQAEVLKEKDLFIAKQSDALREREREEIGVKVGQSEALNHKDLTDIDNEELVEVIVESEVLGVGECPVGVRPGSAGEE